MTDQQIHNLVVLALKCGSVQSHTPGFRTGAQLVDMAQGGRYNEDAMAEQADEIIAEAMERGLLE